MKATAKTILTNYKLRSWAWEEVIRHFIYKQCNNLLLCTFAHAFMFYLYIIMIIFL